MLSLVRISPLFLVVGVACMGKRDGLGDGVNRAEVTLRCPVPGPTYAPGDLVPIAADVRGLRQAVVEFEINGTVVARDASPPFETTYLVGKGERGSKRLVAIARNPHGHLTRSAPIDIGVGPVSLAYRELNLDDISGDLKEGKEPSVTLTTPVRGAVFCHAPSVRFVADVRSVGLVARVDFEIDGSPIATLTKPPYVVTWSPPTPGRHLVAVRATDVDGRVGVTPRVMLLVIGDSSFDETKTP